MTDRLDGVLVVDKPAGMTSHDVVDVVRKVAGQRRVGHTGTLDPDATGVLVLCLGRATRLVRFLQAGKKTYAARIVLGAATTTQDASGDVTEEADASHLTEDAVCAALEAFRGDLEQVPPMVSAVKVGGERLHEKARRGEEVDREARTVTVHDLVLEDFRPGERPELDLLVTCSAGTYIRTIAHDLGARLGVGGHLAELRRLANGPFHEQDAVPLEDIRALPGADALEPLLAAPAPAVAHLPTVTVDDPAAVRQLVHGGRLPAQGLDGPYAVLAGAQLVGIYADDDGSGRPEVVMLRPEDLAEPPSRGEA